MALTNRQANLVRFLNQLSQNIAANSGSGLNTDFSVDLPGLDVDFNVDIGGSGTSGGTEPTPPNQPDTIRQVLLDSLYEQVTVTTPFGPVSGTLIAVEDDYIVLIENGTGDQVLVRIAKIELVSTM